VKEGTERSGRSEEMRQGEQEDGKTGRLIGFAKKSSRLPAFLFNLSLFS
jgi:hypothetical protein